MGQSRETQTPDCWWAEITHTDTGHPLWLLWRIVTTLLSVSSGPDCLFLFASVG